jgi:RimJ/RimL family protein N-acetyltransferase
MLDVGVGMRPDLTGQGRGVGFVGAVLNYGAIIYRPKTFRATIAGFNQRSLRTFQGLGFEVKEEFIREMSDIHFLILEKMIKEEQDGGTSKTANP